MARKKQQQQQQKKHTLTHWKQARIVVISHEPSILADMT